VSRLRTKTLQNGTVSRLRTRAALAPLWGPILAILPGGVLRGAKLRVVFERNRLLLDLALVFERERL